MGTSEGGAAEGILAETRQEIKRREPPLVAQSHRRKATQGTAASALVLCLSVLPDFLKEQRKVRISLETWSSFVILTIMNILERRLFFIFWYFVPKQQN